MNLTELLSIIPSNIEGIIFDLDGTLADNMPLHIRAWAMAGDYFGVKITEADINEFAGAPSFEVITTLNQRYGWTVDVALAVKLKSEYYLSLLDELEDNIPTIDLTYEFALHSFNKYPMAIGTGSNRHNALRVINAIKLSATIPYVVSADDVDFPKPHPETFLKCAMLMAIAPENCIVFEDGPMGIEAAFAAGMPVIEIPSYKLLRKK
jgi:HAD superfamily hydrolase (TIGR01509 family)